MEIWSELKIGKCLEVVSIVCTSESISLVMGLIIVIRVFLVQHNSQCLGLDKWKKEQAIAL